MLDSIIKLVQNYRSHEAILKFPNEQFYGGDLKPHGALQDINAYLGSSYLQNKKFPVVFHTIFGKDDREASSPSFFNIDEATQVKLYIQQLKEDRTFRTRTPFEVLSRCVQVEINLYYRRTGHWRYHALSCAMPEDSSTSWSRVRGSQSWLSRGIPGSGK
jgi:hypothetical protein